MPKNKKNVQAGLAGKIIIAMPAMKDSRFQKTIIYMLEHNEKGAMGLVLNKQLGEVTLSDLFKQMNVEIKGLNNNMPVYFGGPVETERGFILHSPDRLYGQSKTVKGGFALTATTDILKSIAMGEGPSKMIFALGYAGWSAGQLDQEIMKNAWLHVEADEKLVFCGEQEKAWSMALKKLGVSPELLSEGFGTA
ncbi:MAG: hypothetical protein CMP22_02350 [Rickettsiales bacterium]|nr:hypothetical protein [Rickettsiales bacterium]|tara:strand:- start:2208 stop:2786 length:579 start_codon:yes stop_codon:yes gene_type:complete